MRDRFFSSSWSTWAGRLLAFLFVIAMIAVSVVLLRPDTWRREIHAGAAGGVSPVRGVPADEMTAITECFSAVRGESADRRPLPLRRDPLERWSDPAEDPPEGALWAWGERGRPYALLAMERNRDRDRGGDAETWGFELISLTDEPIAVEANNEVRARNARSAENARPVLGGAIHWAPTRPGLTFRDVPHAPPPAQTAQARLPQMQDLMKRFSAAVHSGRPPSSLRLVLDPIDRYADTMAGQVDGAIFVFAVGKNPEVIVLLEAQGPAVDKAAWCYAVAPATVAPFEISIDGKQVWTAPYHSDAENTAEAPYFAVGMPRVKP
jgi:hypothetical protein